MTMRAAVEWSLNNPVLEAGEIGVEAVRLEGDGSLIFETDPASGRAVAKFKSGDGRSAWNALTYADKLLIVSEGDENLETAEQAKALAREARDAAASAGRTAGGAMEVAKASQESAAAAQRAAEEAKTLAGRAKEAAAAVDIAGHNNNADAHAALFGVKIRRRLERNLTLYVRQDGNDNNDGSADTPDKALRSLYGALRAAERYDGGLYEITISLGPGADTRYLSGPAASYKRLVVTSTDVNNKAAIVGFSFMNTNIEFSNIEMTGFFLIWYGAEVTLRDCDFNASTGVKLRGGSYLELQGATKILQASDSIVFSAMENSTLVVAGDIDVQNISSFGTFIHCESGSVVSRWTGNVIGQASGKKYNVQAGGVIDSRGAGPNWLPGDVAGTSSSGGIYV